MGDGCMQGTIMKGVGGFYDVLSGSEIFRCKGRGILRKQKMTPTVGDHVDFTTNPTGDGFIEAILPRKNLFVRPPVANVDVAVVVVSVADPEPNFRILDRFLVMAEQKDVRILLCINKTDLDTGGQLEKIREIYAGIYGLYPVCGLTGKGLPTLKKELKGRTATFAGPSGVGKSTLINRLEPRINAQTGVLSARSGRGRHTTRHVEIFQTDFGARIMDTPGFTSFQVLESEPREIQDFFPEMVPFRGKCRFQDCIHINEPECRIRDAAAQGNIHPSRYESYKWLVADAQEGKRY